MSITIRDVAKEAGVSTMTVSRVVNNKGQVANETRIRVESAMKKLSYIPNMNAQNLVTNKTWTIGVIVPDIANPFFASLVKAGEKICNERGYSMLIGNTEGDLAIERRYISVYQSRMCEAIILVAPRIDDFELSELNKQIPLVVVDRTVPFQDIVQVYLDNTRGAEVATKHLLDLGHTRIGFVMGPEEVPNSHTRYEGYAQALKQAGIPFTKELVYQGDFIVETGRKALEYFESLAIKPTAIFCSNDLMAIGIIERANELDIKIPNQYSLVGFDNIFLSSLVNPRLTTISYPILEMGTKAITLLLDSLLSEAKVQMSENLEHNLIIRNSTRSLYD
ncbi:MAG: LacI family DNA-binding transcriptional regulator [Sphaerochaeta sp.]|nr:LacI family DNA-binding transcriptional regulator [Sphaerochaeta sp.]